ncbi:MAG: phosphate ABC transporter substrate-binding protein PstS [Exilispira sp.]|jgi:phosphate transport system substrate-binding protein|nr:phosphate ABC transporter substrate-binding protein PstS [Exilispira sp.]
MSKKALIFLFLSILLIIFFSNLTAQSKIEITGGGATFPQPFYSKLFDIYYNLKGVKVNYQGIGSGGGIKGLTDKIMDFGATDAPMTIEEEQLTKNPIIHFPTCLGAVVVIYNLPGNPSIRLTGDLIAKIFMGKITKWNDPEIAKVNPSVKMPNLPIIVTRRTDGSGTTYIFSEYLSKASKDWASTLGTGKSLNWNQSTIGQKGNPGVAGFVTQTPGAIGYVELVYAIQNNIKYASVQNSSGNFIEPNLDSVSLAAEVNMADDTKVSLTNTSSKNGYPISSFTWIILYAEQNYNGRSIELVKAMLDLFWFIIHDGQKYAKELGYAPLPLATVKKAEAQLKKVTFNGVPVLK